MRGLGGTYLEEADFCAVKGGQSEMVSVTARSGRQSRERLGSVQKHHRAVLRKRVHLTRDHGGVTGIKKRERESEGYWKEEKKGAHKQGRYWASSAGQKENLSLWLSFLSQSVSISESSLSLGSVSFVSFSHFPVVCVCVSVSYL